MDNDACYISYLTLEHKSSLKSPGYICSNSQQYTVWVKIIVYNYISILTSCSMRIFCKFPTINISKLNLSLLICIAKNSFEKL